MADILSQDEMNALLKGVADGTIPAGGDAGAARRGVQTLDLTSQERSLRGRMPGLELVLDRLVRGLRTSLAGLFGQQPPVAVTGVELVKFARVTERLPQPICLQLFRLTPLAGQGMLVVTPPLAAALLQVVFGGHPSRRTPLAARELSALEQRALERFATRVLQDLQEAWRPIAALELGFLRSETVPMFACIVPPQELVLHLDLRLDVDGSDDARLWVCIPNAALDPLRPRLQTPPGAESTGPRASWGDRVRAVLAAAELELSAELGTRRMRVREVLGLKVGDVLPLATGREGPVLVRVEGRPRFLGAPGVSAGSNAIRITGRI